MCQVLAGALTTFVLGKTEKFTFYSILSLFGIVAIVMICLVQSPVPNPSVSQNNQVAPKNNREKSVFDALRGFSALMKDSQYLFFYLGIFLSGIPIGCYITFLGSGIRIAVDSGDTNIINESIGYGLLALALGEVSAGLLTGRLADIYDKLQMFNVTIIINETAIVFTILGCLFKSLTCSIIGSFLFGFGDTGIQTMINTLIGFMFGGKPELFSAYRFLQSSGFVYTAIIGIIMAEYAPVSFLMCIGASCAVFHMLYLRYKPEKQYKPQVSLLHDDKMREMINLKDT